MIIIIEWKAVKNVLHITKINTRSFKWLGLCGTSITRW